MGIFRVGHLSAGRMLGLFLVGLMLIMMTLGSVLDSGRGLGAATPPGSAPPQSSTTASELDHVKVALDVFALDHGAGEVRSWYVDIPTHQVVVTTTGASHDAPSRRFLAQARSFEPLVRIEEQSGELRTTANLYGGQNVNLSDGYVCTSGFNARTASGQAVMITAGHCATGRPSLYRKGKKIGATYKYSFPRNDYGLFKVNSSVWKPRASVVRWDGRVQAVRGFSKVKAGTSICKSGRTTHWTCGKVRAYNETVNFGHGKVVTGLVRHTACVEDGDSGGAVMSGTKAQGVTSGAELWKKGSRYVCGSKVGRANVSYYQPIGEVLSAYKLKLLVR